MIKNWLWRETYLDRKDWPKGRWDNEVDRLVFKDEKTGYLCLANRNSQGAWCGYVAIEKDHPLYEKDYDYEIEVENKDLVKIHPNISPMYLMQEAIKKEQDKKVALSLLLCCHGGVTFSDFLTWFNEKWAFGFDCSHAGDLIPKYGNETFGDIYRDFNYVIKEIQELARQLKEFENV